MTKQDCIQVGCVPPACWPYALGEGVYVCVYPSMHWAGGCLPVGICLGGCLPGGVFAPLWTDRNLWKHNLCKLRLPVVKITTRKHFSMMCTTHLLTVSHSIKLISGAGVCPTSPWMQTPQRQNPPPSEADPQEANLIPHEQDDTHK